MFWNSRIKYIIFQLEIKEGGVLVHCAAGISRVYLKSYIVSNFGYCLYHEEKSIGVQGCNKNS